MPPKSRLDKMRQSQKQNVIVNLHLADRAKRRRRLRRGGANRARPIMQPPPLQITPPRRMLQQTIYLPPEAIPPQTPFRSQPDSHPQYVKTTEHKKMERELYAQRLQVGIDELIARKIEAYERNAIKPTIKKEVEIKKEQPQPYIPFPPERIVTGETPLFRARTPRRTTREVSEEVSMERDPNPLLARQVESITIRRIPRREDDERKKRVG